MYNILHKYKTRGVYMDKNKVINAMFKSMTISGKAVVKSIDGEDITNEVYVDLSDNNYFLNESIQQTNMIFSGRRGTGKTTIFVAAQNLIEKEEPKVLPIYINLQTCYEQMDLNNNQVKTMLTQQNFLKKIFITIKDNMSKYQRLINHLNFKRIFKEIEEGRYFNIDTESSVLSESNKKGSLSTNINATPQISVEKSLENKTIKTINNKRVLSISPILESLKNITSTLGKTSIILFLDDFSELDKSDQKLITDNIIAPIISGYNDFYKIKLATYPGRFHLGNIDATKVITKSLDFYDVYKGNEKKSSQIEKDAIDFIERTLNTRLSVFSKNRLNFEDIFEIDEDNTKDMYLKLLFDCTAAIPRTLGFILDSAYEISINKNEKIKLSDIQNASQKYYEENIYKDFYNDYRYKESFQDEEKSLTREYQKKLIDRIVENSQNIKTRISAEYHKKTANKLFTETINSKPHSLNQLWLPTSHFYINKNYEYLLDTLELHFLVSKIQENSNKNDSKLIDSVYALNYGLCLSNKIDYGKPNFRRTYDYWRAKEFNIGDVFESFEKYICSSCKHELNESEYNTFIKFERCPACGEKNCVSKELYLPGEDLENIINKEGEITRNTQKYPDKLIDILRFLENNPGNEYSAHDIAINIDSHHLPVTNYIRMISDQGYILVRRDDKKYYKKNPDKSFFEVN